MARTQEELRASGVMLPMLTEAINVRPFNIESDDPLEFRKLRADHLAALRQFMPLGGKPIPEVEERDVFVTVRDGAKVRVRIYTPVKSRRLEGGGPLILMFHEGGFKYGDLTDEEMNCRLFAREFGAICANVDYRLAPDHLFPTWINDSWDITRYFAANHAAFEADPFKGFIVGGSSAGGNISAVLAQLSRIEELVPPITGQYLSVPLIFPLEKVPEKYKDELLSPWESTSDPVLKGLGADRLKAYTTTLGVDFDSHLFTPLASPSYPPSACSSAGTLAPAYMQVAGLDPLRDHALIYDRILREEYKTESKVDVYAGLGHMFWTNWPEMKESHDFVDDTLKGIRWLLQQTPNR